MLGLVVVDLARFYLATQVLDVAAETINAVLWNKDGQLLGVFALFVVTVFTDRPFTLLGKSGFEFSHLKEGCGTFAPWFGYGVCRAY